MSDNGTIQSNPEVALALAQLAKLLSGAPADSARKRGQKKATHPPVKPERCREHTAHRLISAEIEGGRLVCEVACKCGVRGTWRVAAEQLEIVADDGYWEDED